MSSILICFLAPAAFLISIVLINAVVMSVAGNGTTNSATNNSPTNNSMNNMDKSFLYDNMLGVRKREYNEAAAALKAEKAEYNSLPSDQAIYVRVDQAVKAIINARKRAPKLRRRAELMGSVAHYASPSVHESARRGPRLSLLNKASELEAAANEAADYLGVSTDAHKQALIKAAHARLDELKAEAKARKERIRTLRHVVFQAEGNLRSAAEDVLKIEGVNAFMLSDNGVPSHVLEGLF